MPAFGLHRTDVLPLHAPGAAASGQLLYLARTDQVEVARYGLFQAARRHGKLQRLFGILLGKQPVDQPARKRVAAADAVDEADVVAA